MKGLKISEDLTLPADFITQTCAILARRGAGKSYTGSVLSEEMIEAGLHVCIIDPIGVFWGLRSSVDGRSEGLPVVIFGGDHGDLPLESTAGTLIADVVMDKKVLAIIDLSLMRKGEQDRFVCDFAERLYFKNRDPIHLIVDEADSFAPQKPMPGQQRMLGAMEDLVRKGRARGIGMTMVTQRSAVINKNLLSQIEVLICLQTTSPHDQDAVLHWVETHGTDKQRETMMASLASLDIGRAWVWSPSWAKCFKLVKIRARRTFDSSATPKVGAKRTEPKKLAPVEIESLKLQMTAIIEKKKLDDPRELKKRIADLERQVASKPQPVTQKTPKTIVKTEQVIDPKLLEKIGAAASKVTIASADAVAKIEKASDQVMELLRKIAESVRGLRPVEKPVILGQYPRIESVISEKKIRTSISKRINNPTGDGAGNLPTGERTVLAACIQFENGVNRAQLTTLTGFAQSTRNTYLQRLQQRAYICERSAGVFTATEAGRAALPDFQPLPTGEKLREYWHHRLPEGERVILDILINAYPESCSRDILSNTTGYADSTRNTYIQRLSAKELVQTSSDGVKANDNLF